MIDEDRSNWTLGQLADEVIEACELPMGCRGTIIGALGDAKAQGRAACDAYAEKSSRILAELVAVKDIKEERDQLGGKAMRPGVITEEELERLRWLRDEYGMRQPKAWEAARVHLSIPSTNPSPSGHATAEASLNQRGEASGPVGVGPLPWVVRLASGTLLGPFPSNEAAVAWTDANKIDWCDYEDVTPVPRGGGFEATSPLGVNRQIDIDVLVQRFLTWPLPDSVCSDTCTTRPCGWTRTGTNLLTADEARLMIAHLLETPSQGNSR